MDIIRSYRDLSLKNRGASIAIGNFDGVHMGHRSIICLAKDYAKKFGVPLGVLTFEPHPRAFFAPEMTDFRISGPQTRAERLQGIGVEKLYELTFDSKLSQLTSEQFAKEIISEGLGAAHVVVGANFRFGKNRSGDIELLKLLGERYRFDVTIAPMLEYSGSDKISSSEIRQALREGRPDVAAKKLGQWHMVKGRIIKDGNDNYKVEISKDGLDGQGMMPPKAGFYSVGVEIYPAPCFGYQFGTILVDRMKEGFQIQLNNKRLYSEIEGLKVSVKFYNYLGSDYRFDESLGVSGFGEVELA